MGLFFPLPHGISFFLNMVCDATHLPASLGNTRWCFARWKLQSPTREQSAYPDPPGRSAWIFIVPGYSGKERVMGMSTAAGRLRESQRHQLGAVTWMGCHCCWERSQVGTIKCHVKRFSKLIFISFLLIISPQIAGYNTPAYCPFSSGIPGSATRCTDPLVCLSAHTSNCAAH